MLTSFAYGCFCLVASCTVYAFMTLFEVVWYKTRGGKW